MADKFGGQILGELGQIAKDIGKQTVKVPGDIAGKALESLGAKGSNTKTPTVTVQAPPGESAKPESAWEQIDREGDRNIKRQIARRALEELTRGPMKKKEPSIWERLQQENEQKKEIAAKQQAAASAQSVPAATAKRPRGDLYGAKAKQTATENRNVRQD